MPRRLTFRNVKATFLGLPPLFKLLIVLVIVNVPLIARTANIQHNVIFESIGLMKSINIGVYWDSNCTKPVDTGIDWGIIEPGTNKTVTLFVKNEGNWETTLSLQATKWSSPEAEQFLSLSANYQGQPVQTGEVIPVELSLSVESETRDIELFSFEVVIEARG